MGGDPVVVRLDERSIGVLVRALEAEYRKLRIEQDITINRIKRFEEKYGMSSRDFLEKYTRGELSDDEEFIEWYGELMFLERINKEIEELKKLARQLSRKIHNES